MPGPKFNNSNTKLENAKLRETNMYISPNFGDNSLHLQTRLSKNLDALPTFYVEPFEKRVVETYTIVKGKRIKNTYRLSESGRSYGIGTPSTNAYTFQNDVQNLVLSDNAENVIIIENVGEQLISEAVDALDPGTVFRENFIVYDVENDINYIYTGSENTYGVNEDEQANEEDFIIIPSEAELPQSLSDFQDDIGATIGRSNLILGGVGGSIISKQLLAEQFNFAVSDIKSFSLFENNVYAQITRESYKNSPNTEYTVPYLFSDNSSLTFIEEKDGYLTELSGNFCLRCDELLYVKAKGVKQIGSSLFLGAEKLIPEKCDFSGVEQIGEGSSAFRDILTLGTIDFPNLLRIVGGYTFRGTKWSINAPKLENIQDTGLSGYPLQKLNAPNLKELGINNFSPTSESEITVDYSLKTAYNGQPSLSLQNVLSVGGTVNYANKLSDLGDNIGATELEVIKVTEKSQIVNKDLDATKVYKILRSLSLTSTETIRLNNSPIIKSLGADLITISTSEPDSIIFEGDNCKNVNIQNINLTAAGNGSKVFDIINAEGNHEFRLVGVNFTGSESAGNVTGFRQWFTKDIGLYGCKDGFTLYGAFNGMFCQELNLFGFPATGTLFKKGQDLTFTNRAFISVNFAVPSGAILTDFDESVFLENELFQLVNCIAKVDGGFNDNNVNTLVPNISANSSKSLWSGNSGLPNTAIEKIVIDDNVSGSYEIDWLNDTYDLTLTGDTTFTEKNLPASGRRTKTINISVSGEFTPTLPEEWTFNQVGSYKGDDLNRIIVTYLSNTKYITQIINSLSAFPAPLPTSFNPSSALPNTGNLLIDVEGSYFKPGMKIEISDWTITQQIVKTDNKIQLIVDVGDTEGDAVVKMNNGAESITQNLFFVSTGTVFIPQEEEFTDLVGNLNLNEPGEATLTNYNVDESATWNRELDYTKDWSLIFSGRQSNLGVPQNAGPIEIQLIKVSGGSTSVSANFKTAGQQRQFCFFRAEETNEAITTTSFNNTFSMEENKLEIRCFNGLVSFYDNDNLLLETSQVITENLKMKITLDTYNVFNIKYIEY